MIVNEPVPRRQLRGHPRQGPRPDWFKRAVFYEVLVRSFKDSNGDGTGDLKGLTAKLDYLQWLGVDCLWLPPFFKSPLRDGGYDVSDYTDVLPEFGDLADFVEFVDAAHQRGMRVIIDFVMNHTSDQHPWFQASRTDPDGPYGDFYVWADDDRQYPDARIIFVDTESSNWTFDPVRKQYFWHRFFSHQPDLNFENPARPGGDHRRRCSSGWTSASTASGSTPCPTCSRRRAPTARTSPRTHDFLKRVRKEIDAALPRHACCCAEANQWPEDVVDYFGDSERRRRVPHGVPLPGDAAASSWRVRRESRYPVSEILAQTPAIPDNCQWGIFLRNHDELTLEMVTDEERDYMWAEYAKDPRMTRQHRHPPPARPAAGQRPQPDRAVHRAAAVAARLADPLLRRRDRHGRQHLARRPRRRPHPDAVDPRPQRRLLLLRPGPALPARRSWTRSTATRSPTSRRQLRQPVLAAALDPADDRDPQAEPGLRPRHLHRPAAAPTRRVLSFVREFGDDIVLCVNNFSRFAAAHRARPARAARAATRSS